MGNKPSKETELLDAAADGNLHMVRYLVEQGADIDKQDNDGNTPLIEAAAEGYLEVVQYLVEQGADKEKQDSGGNTPLIAAAKYDHLDVVRYLIEQGVDKEKKDKYNNTSLIAAAENDHLDVVQYLVEQGVDKEKQDKYNNTSLIAAAENGHLDVVRYLVEQGVDKEKKDKYNNTSLIAAGENGHLDVVRYLVEQGVDKEKQDKYGNTSLMCAASNSHLDVVQYLIQNGADPTGINKDRNSVLLLLLTQGISEDELLPVAELLLEHGTPLFLSNNEGKSARSIAKTKCFHNIYALVEKYAAKPPASRGEPEVEKSPKWFIPPEDVTKVDAALAVGGFGRVYRATWADSDVVVKEVSVVELKRFFTEVDTWRNLRHTNVVQFHGANHLEEPYFIVSQYAPKGDLVPYLKSEKDQGRNIVWRKLKEVAAGVKYLHRQGVVHGDLKGNNIVVSDNGTAMLTDFGLSFLESGSCSVKKIKDTLGAMAWRAPEFANLTVKTPTRKSDVYSLGMVIIEAVTLKNPWSGYHDQEIRDFLRNGEILVNKPDEMTDEQWELVEWMVAVSPDDRPDLSEVVLELEKFADDEEMEEDGL